MQKNLVYLSTFILLVFAFTSVASASTISLNEPSSTLFTGDSIPFNVTVSDYSGLSINGLNLNLYDNNTNTLIKSKPTITDNSEVGQFVGLNPGIYKIVAQVIFNDSSMNFAIEIVELQNNLTLLFEDPTPENNTLLNMFAVPLDIKASANQMTDSITVIVNNLDNNLTLNNTEYNVSSTDMTFPSLIDGNYSFYLYSIKWSEIVYSDTRYITIKTVPIQAFNITVDPAIPSSFIPGSNLSFSSNFSLSDSGIVYVSAISSTNTYQFNGSYHVNESTEMPLNFSWLNIPEGQYNLYLMTQDSYGNIGKFLLGSVNVANPIITPVLTGGGGGGGGSIRSSENVTNLNNTNNNETNLPNETQPEIPNFTETPNENQTNENSGNGFGSLITGAVIGVFSKPTTAVLAILIVIAIIYLVVRIRNYTYSEEKKTTKKNGKSSE